MQCKITVKRSESERVKSMMTSCGVMMPAQRFMIKQGVWN